MELVDRILRRYLNLTPNEKVEFHQKAGLKPIPGFKHPERITVLKPNPKGGTGKRSGADQPMTTVNSLSFEQRQQFIAEHATEEFKRKHGL